MATDTRKHKWQARSERLARATTITSLKAEACETRARYAQRAQDAIQADALLAYRTSIFCARTGTLLGSFNEFIPATLAQLPIATAVENELLFSAQRFYHPAWLNLSPEILAKLQLLFPREYCVYAAHELQHDNGATNGEDRNRILAWLGHAPLDGVTELAELLRRVLAMVGHYRDLKSRPEANNATPAGAEMALPARRANINCPQIADFREQSVYAYIAALREFFAAVVKRTQAEFHVQSIYRQRQVTLQDVRRIGVTLGRQQFRLAREQTPNADNAAFFDVAEIFSDTSELTMTISAKHAESRKGMRYTGAAHKAPDTIDDSAATLDVDALAQTATSAINTAPAVTPASSNPNGSPLKIQLFRKG